MTTSFNFWPSQKGDHILLRAKESDSEIHNNPQTYVKGK